MLLFAAQGLRAASDFYPRFKQVGREDGLSQSYVLTIDQDKQGYLWMGTQDGLNRFDGRDFLHFYNDEADPESIAGSEIQDVAIANDGGIWVATKKGLSRLDPLSYQATNYFSIESDVTTLSSSITRARHIDEAGMVWVGSENGLDRLDPGTGKAQRYSLSSSGDAVQVHQIVATDKADEFWVASSMGLLRFSATDGIVDSFSKDAADWRASPFADVGSVLVARDGALWFGQRGSESGEALVRWVPGEERLTKFNHDGELGRSLISESGVSVIFEDPAGYIWIGQQSGGLNRYNPEDGLIDFVAPSNIDSASLAHETVTSIFQDDNGLLWVGTFGGASYLSFESLDVQWFSEGSAESGELNSDRISGFAELATGEIVVTTLDAGLSVLDPATRTFTPFNERWPGLGRLSSRQLTAALVDSRERLWVATKERGLNLVNFESATVTRYRYDSDDPGSLPRDRVAALVEDGDGNIWVGTMGGGLARYVESVNQFEYWQQEPDNIRSLSSDHVLSLYRDSLGNLWVGHYGFGVDKLDPTTGLVTRALADTELADAVVSAMREDSRGDLWIATQDKGLWRWSYENRRAGNTELEAFTERSGLANQTIYAAVQDLDGLLWLATVVGLTRFDPEFLTVDNFDSGQGVLFGEFNFGAAFRASDGRLYFGSDAGFNAFYPADMTLNTTPPTATISAIEVVGENLPATIVNDTERVIELAHTDYSILFDVKALDYAASEKHLLQYKLEGLDEDWQDAGTRSEAAYTSLSPGDYTFQARVSNNSEIWSHNTVERKIRVLPPPWATIYAYIAYVLVALGLALILLRAHASRLRERATKAHAEELAAVNFALTDEVAQRREKEIALSREKVRAETYFNVAEVVLVTLNADGEVLRMNQKGGELIGDSPENIAGQSWFSFIPEEWRESVRDELQDMLRNDAHVAGDYFEFPLLGKEGREHLVAWQCKRISNDDGTHGVFCSGMDVTKVRTLEKQIRLREKMNAIGTLAGGIAHDFNNILQAIYGFTTLALERVSPGDEKAIYLQQVVKGADRARNLVKRILTFSNQQEYDLESIDLEPVVREAVALLRGSLPATVEIGLDIDESRAPVRADPTRIHQIVMNLGTNAGQSMVANGGRLEVTLGTQRVEEVDNDSNSRLRPGFYMRLSITDSGTGMTRETQDHIFDPFFTTKDENENTGLGLTVVHGIVQSHGGYIEVDSAPGRGTRFDVYFPASEIPVAVQAVPRKDTTQGNERILVVDDEAWVLTVTGKMLTARGYEVVAVSGGHEALDALNTDPRGFQLMITDETMPRITGSDLIRQARESQPDLPVLVISGKLAPQSIELDNTWFLSKPFTANELTTQVRHVLDGIGTSQAERASN